VPFLEANAINASPPEKSKTPFCGSVAKYFMVLAIMLSQSDVDREVEFVIRDGDPLTWSPLVKLMVILGNIEVNRIIASVGSWVVDSSSKVDSIADFGSEIGQSGVGVACRRDLLSKKSRGQSGSYTGGRASSAGDCDSGRSRTRGSHSDWKVR